MAGETGSNYVINAFFRWIINADWTEQSGRESKCLQHSERGRPGRRNRSPPSRKRPPQPFPHQRPARRRAGGGGGEELRHGEHGLLRGRYSHASTLETNKKEEEEAKKQYEASRKPDKEEEVIVRDASTGILYNSKTLEPQVSSLTTFEKIKHDKPWEMWWAIKKERNSQLIKASELGDAYKVRELLSVRKHKELIANINTKSLDDFTPLHLAVSELHLDTVKVLLSRGTLIDPVTTSLMTPLHLACYRGNKEIVKLLVEKGADINARDGDGNTPAHILSSQGSLHILQWLLERKPNIALKNNYGETPSEVVANAETRALFVQYAGEETGNYSRTVLNKNMVLHNNRADMVKLLMFRGRLLTSHGVEEHKEEPSEKKTEQPFVKDNKRRLVRIIEIAKERSKPSETPITDEDIDGKEEKGSDQAEERIGPESFELIQQLGKGSFGEVYLVQLRNTTKLYAMKIMDKNRFRTNNLLKYAEAERNVLCYTKHPFIVGLDYAFQTAKRLFLLLEFCPG
eukprot:TRINITY_DN1874_c0_g1_i7.p1 TRINITY_DN1874_c0_g1~~TRINITY_DN1874_c0_g1_i7.p1  ORF type:complete len:515 (+),score=99.78 TRINITY_DN1874_c0_g1_i7:135-1679(+)